MQQNQFVNCPNFYNMFAQMMGMNMNMNMFNNGANNGAQGINLDPNDPLRLIYGGGQNNNQPTNQNQFIGPNDKINIVFKTTGGLISNLTVDPDKTITDTLLIYLKRVNKTEYYKPNKDIFFLNNAKRIDVYDKRKIRELFGFNLGQIIIIVNDVKNLIGAS